MKFVLLSRHTGGSAVPATEAAQNLEDLGAWVTLLGATEVLAIRGGKTVSASSVVDYVGDLGGVLIFEADDLDHAVALAMRSPGLKYGFTHEVFPEVSVEDAAHME